MDKKERITLEKYDLKYAGDFVDFVKEFQQYGDEFEAMGILEAVLKQYSINKKYTELTEKELNDIFPKYVKFAANAEKYETLEKKDWVEADFYAICKNSKMIGEIIFRKRLNPFLVKTSYGHIGYKIKHSERGKGYGNIAFQLLLEKAWKDGYTELMVGCKENNFTSARLIEKNGGILNRLNKHDNGEVCKEYWIFKNK